MKKREDIVQKFSTFLRMGDRQSIWQADRQLEGQMKRLVQSDPDAKEEFWARYFLKTLRELSQQERNPEVGEPGRSRSGDTADTRLCDRTYSLAVISPQNLEISILITGRHLSAYLQEACLWAAKKSHQKYFNILREKYTIEEYFQIASSVANLPAKLFKNFNLERPRSNVEGYSKIVFIRFIRDKIYQQNLEAKRVKFSDYGLLKDLSIKELKQALASQGIPSHKIELYPLVWQCFNEIYKPQKEVKNGCLEPPNPQHLDEIFECYKQRLNQLNLLNLPAGESSQDTIQEMLEICIKAARNYRTKQFFPLEEYDNISDPMLTPWDIAVQEEERQQVQLLVSKLFDAVPKAGQTMLILWQGLNLTQSEIATVVKTKYPDLQKQYQVARHLARYTQNLLKDFVNEWNQINPDNRIDNERNLEEIQTAFNDCLESHCKRLINSILEKISKNLNKADKLLLIKNQPKATRLLQKAENSNKTLEIQQFLIKDFISQLEIQLDLSLDLNLSLENKLSFSIREWLIYEK